MNSNMANMNKGKRILNLLQKIEIQNTKQVKRLVSKWMSIKNSDEINLLKTCWSGLHPPLPIHNNLNKFKYSFLCTCIALEHSEVNSRFVITAMSS